jgi:hypothetical protein
MVWKDVLPGEYLLIALEHKVGAPVDEGLASLRKRNFATFQTSHINPGYQSVASAARRPSQQKPGKRKKSTGLEKEGRAPCDGDQFENHDVGR